MSQGSPEVVFHWFTPANRELVEPVLALCHSGQLLSSSKVREKLHCMSLADLTLTLRVIGLS